MKTTIITIVLMLMLSSSTYADVEGQLSIGGGVGWFTQPDAFTDFWHPGASFRAEGGVSVAHRIALLGGVSYSSYAVNEKAMLRSMGLQWTPAQIIGGGVSVLTLTGGFNLHLAPDTLPVWTYLVARCGYSRLSVDDITLYVPNVGAATVPMDGTGVFGLEGGFGLSVRTTHYLNIFCEGVYLHRMESGKDTGTMQIHAGLRMRFSGTQR